MHPLLPRPEHRRWEARWVPTRGPTSAIQHRELTTSTPVCGRYNSRSHFQLPLGNTTFRLRRRPRSPLCTILPGRGGSKSLLPERASKRHHTLPPTRRPTPVPGHSSPGKGRFLLHLPPSIPRQGHIPSETTSGDPTTPIRKLGWIRLPRRASKGLPICTSVRICQQRRRAI